MHVVATAGHVDHGKSSLILRLTGIDPDRWEEEKRRGLTIDLGFAWTTLPSGREIGFVDVPGHERFVRNMLAGVGPVRLVLFVVAADEGAPVVACSSSTGRGLDQLVAAIDAMVAEAPAPQDRGRPRIDIDRSFTIRGAGTVVTGTLTGGTLRVGNEVVVLPEGRTARIRSLQTHRRTVEVAEPVSRVAANLASTSREEVVRGDVLVRPGQWRPTSVVEARLRPVRSMDRPLSTRGAFKLYAGSAERDARLRLYGDGFARIRLSRPVVVEVGDGFVLREAGRGETLAGGVILDPDPPARPGRDPEDRLARRESARPEDLPAVVVAERGAVRAATLPLLAGAAPASIAGTTRVGGWWVADERLADLRRRVIRTLEAYHREQPLRPGLDAGDLRRAILTDSLDHDLLDAVLQTLLEDGVLAREGPVVRLAEHRVTLGDREPQAERLVAAVARGEPTPPSVPELAASGFARDMIEACVRTGRLARVSPELVVTPAFLARAEEAARAEAALPEGLTVSRFRELLGTTRKYALPILASFDARGLTRRDGDIRRPGPSGHVLGLQLGPQPSGHHRFPVFQRHLPGHEGQTAHDPNGHVRGDGRSRRWEVDAELAEPSLRAHALAGAASGALPLAEDGLPLDLVQAAPDAVGLTVAQGVLEALRPNRAAGADGLGALLAGLLLLLALEVVRREELLGVLAAARRVVLPADVPVVDGQVRHRRPPNFSNFPCANLASLTLPQTPSIWQDLNDKNETPAPESDRLSSGGGGGLVDRLDRLYETARALGEETRFKVYRAICVADDPVPVSALADSFSLHPNAIRQHLGRLEQAGLVVSRADRDGIGAGR